MPSDVEVAVITAPPGLGAERSASAVSWAAVIAGAFVAAATSLILIALGSGLGLAAVRPWPGAGAAATTFGVMTGIWIIVTQWFASGVGGYITGRLRTRWTGTHTHEVFFRDTAHGFLTWSVSTVVVVALAASLVTMAADVGARRTAAATPGAEAGGLYAYETASLLRSPQPDTSPSAETARAEVGMLLARAAAPAPRGAGAQASDDRAWLTDLVTAHTGLAPEQASARVDATIAQARDKAEKARKAASAASIFTALSMLVGAFVACAAAALGGQLRDEHL